MNRPATRNLLAACMCVGFFASGCVTLAVSDDIRVVETIPEPVGISPAAHRIERSLGLGEDTDDLDSGRVTGVSIAVVDSDDADLFSLLRIDINVSAGGERSLLATAEDFAEGETARNLSVAYTADIKPFLAAEDFTLEWDVYYKAGIDFPRGGLDLETVIEFDINVRIL